MSPDGTLFASIYTDNSVVVYNKDTQIAQIPCQINLPLTALGISYDNQKLALAFSNGFIHIYNIQSGTKYKSKFIFNATNHSGSPKSIINMYLSMFLKNEVSALAINDKFIIIGLKDGCIIR